MMSDFVFNTATFVVWSKVNKQSSAFSVNVLFYQRECVRERLQWFLYYKLVELYALTRKKKKKAS